jgi:ribosomal protein L21E
LLPRSTWLTKPSSEEVEQTLRADIPKIGELVRIITDNSVGIMMHTDVIGKSGLVIGVDDSMGVIRILVHIGDRQLLLFPDMLDIIHNDHEDDDY